MNRQAAFLNTTINPELKQLIADTADEQGIGMNELISEILCRHFNRPELARIPRKHRGRPCKAKANGREKVS